MIRYVVLGWSRLAAIALLLLPTAMSTAVASAKIPMVPKWGRFEQEFKSGVVYSNALQDTSLSVLFTSPLGETREVDGFWDGGRSWRVRFSPDQVGRWTFKTTCADQANAELHNQTGEFLCTVATGESRFHKHGPVRVARDQQHLEHADGTPFFWLADTVWNGAREAGLKDWGFYVQTRAAQRFTVAQWAVAPGDDPKRQCAYTGFPERIGVNADFFKRLDAKLEILSQAGILSAIAPLLELQSEKNTATPLPDDQAELLVRYAVARWGADPVAWLVAFESDTSARNVGRWKRIGQRVFSSRPHAPVVLFAGETQWLFEEFRDLKWVDVFGFQCMNDGTEDALKWTLTGPFATEWKKLPLRPVISFLPCENSLGTQSRKRFSADDVRRAMYWSLLMTAPAGISYGAQGVADWDTRVDPQAEKIKGAALPLWRKALFMPAAKQVAHLARLVNSVDFWRLRPDQKALAAQPGEASPGQFVAAAASTPKGLMVVYTPQDRTFDLSLAALPAAPSVGWLNPRTGENDRAPAIMSGPSCKFTTPGAGDWILVVRAGK